MLTVAASPWKSALFDLQKTPAYAVKADLSRVHVFNEMVIFELWQSKVEEAIVPPSFFLFNHLM